MKAEIQKPFRVMLIDSAVYVISTSSLVVCDSHPGCPTDIGKDNFLVLTHERNSRLTLRPFTYECAKNSFLLMKVKIFLPIVIS